MFYMFSMSSIEHIRYNIGFPVYEISKSEKMLEKLISNNK